MPPLVKYLCGFILGWLIYMGAMMTTVYDGMLSLLFQPFMAALASGVFVAIALLFGLPLRTPKISKIWHGAGWRVLFITTAAIGIMIFHARLGLQTEWMNPQTGEKIKTMTPLAGLAYYLLAIFPIVNFPGKKPPKPPAPRHP